MVAVSLALFIRTFLQRLTRLQVKQRVARFLCGSWDSCSEDLWNFQILLDSILSHTYIILEWVWVRYQDRDIYSIILPETSLWHYNFMAFLSPGWALSTVQSSGTLMKPSIREVLFIAVNNHYHKRGCQYCAASLTSYYTVWLLDSII